MMKFGEIRRATESAIEELFASLLTQEEQCALQGCGAGAKGDVPYIFLSFRKGDEKAEEFKTKWNGQVVKGVEIVAEVRPIAYLH